MNYPVSAGALLYAVLLRGHEAIYGVKNVLASLQKETIPDYFRSMEKELIASGLGPLDFGGNFSLGPDFEALEDACACCGSALLVPARQSHRERMLTCYLCEKAQYVLEEVNNGNYVLYQDVDPAQRIVAFLGLREDEGTLKEACVDSSLIQKRDQKGLLDAGCSEELASLVLNAAKGIDGYTQIVRITDNDQSDMITLLYSDAGTVRVDVEYPWGQGLFRLTPVTAQWVTDRIREFLVLFSN